MLLWPWDAAKQFERHHEAMGRRGRDVKALLVEWYASAIALIVVAGLTAYVIHGITPDRAYKAAVAWFASAIALVLTAYVTHWITLEPRPDCKTSPTAESWAPDRAYKATVFKKDCNMSESIFYSVRVDAFSPPERHSFFTTRELEAAVWSEPLPPELTWSTPRQLEITMATARLGGRLTERVGDSLTIIRIFEPKPAAFPYD
jgi:hypothetical protein